jgi:hypothetical protein
MLTANVRIEGIRIMLFHRFGPDSLPLEKQERDGVAGNNPQEWRGTALVTKDGQLYIPNTYVFSCVRDAGKYTKKQGRGTLVPFLAATLQVAPEVILFDRWWPGFPNGHEFDLATVDAPPDDPMLPVFLDIRGVKNPGSKGRNVRYRIAQAAGWACSFQLLFDPTIVSRSEMAAVLNDAGQLVGLGNGRNIGFGRFDVTSFEVVNA